MTGLSAGRSALAVIILVAAAVGLGACGKRGALEAPPGVKGQFKYPRQYPNRPAVTPLPKPAPKPADSTKPKPEGGAPAQNDSGDDSGNEAGNDKVEQDGKSK